MAGSRKGKNPKKKKSNQPIPPGATRKAWDAIERPGGPPHTPLDDRHALGTPGGGTEVGGLAGTDIGDGAPENADLDEAMAGTLEEEAREDSPPYSGTSGGAVGGTPAEGRTSGGRTHGGIRPGGVHRGDSTIGADPEKG